MWCNTYWLVAFSPWASVKDFTCNTCHYAKQHKLSFSSSHSTASRPFSLLHMDIWGPYSIPSIHVHRFFLTIVDDNNRFTWIFLMINKFETWMHIANFINLIETQFNTRVQTIRTDNGAEFLMQNFFNSKGIVHQTTCIETPQQNGVVERKHQDSLMLLVLFFFIQNYPLVFGVMHYYMPLT